MLNYSVAELRMKKKFLCTVALILIVTYSTTGLYAQTTNLTGKTFSYTDETSGVTSYFSFMTPTDVSWYFGSPSRFIFPAGNGKYNSQNGTITFSHTYTAHQKICIYYGDSDIVFGFRIVNQNVSMKCMSDVLLRYYNNGNTFNATLEPYSIPHDSYLVGTSWVYESFGEHTWKVSLYFKSKTEVLIDGATHLYVCIGNFVSIKTGDNLGDENLVGTYTSQQMHLYRDGLAGSTEDDNLLNYIFKRVE